MSIVDEFKKVLKSPGIIQDFENNLDLGSGVQEVIWEDGLGKKDSDFEDDELPIEGEEWNKALRAYIDKAFEEFLDR